MTAHLSTFRQKSPMGSCRRAGTFVQFKCRSHVNIIKNAIHFGTHDATLHAARLDRRDVHLPPHHPRRHRPDHRLGDGVRRALAAVQRPAPAAARPADVDRVRAPARGGRRITTRRRARSVRLVAATRCGRRGAGCVQRADCPLPPSTALYRPLPPRGGGVHRSRIAHTSGGVGGGHGEAQPPAPDGDPPPRHRDAVARGAHRGGAGGSDHPALTGGANRPGPGIRDGAARRARRRAGRGRRRDGAARPPSAAPGGARRRGGGGVGGARGGGAVRAFPSPRALARLWPLIRPHRWKLLLATACLAASAAIGLAFPQIVRGLLDAAFVRHDRALLDRIAVLLLGLFTVQALSNFAQTYLLSSTGERVVARLRQNVFEHLLTLSPAFFAERRTGELVSRLSADVGTIQGLVSYQLSEFARQTLYLVGGITLLTLTNRHLTLTAVVVVPLVAGSAVFFGRRLRRISTGVQD